MYLGHLFLVEKIIYPGIQLNYTKQFIAYFYLYLCIGSGKINAKKLGQVLCLAYYVSYCLLNVLSTNFLRKIKPISKIVCQLIWGKY